MCGIAGFTHHNRKVDRGVGRRITEALFHRGPDQQGVFEGSEATLCAVRLKIIDLAAATSRWSATMATP
jgi:asparagine synthase (glutamine-hydrolysing)